MTYLEDERFSGEFKFIFTFFDQVSEFERLELHDASDG